MGKARSVGTRGVMASGFDDVTKISDSLGI